MPDLEWNKRWGEQAENFQTGTGYFNKHKVYGYQWGDPRAEGYSAKFVLEEFLKPNAAGASTILEIGPGGGRYSQFLQDCDKLYLVEYNTQFFPILDELLKDLRAQRHYIASPGCAMPGVLDNTVDLVFSFDCFVHLDEPLIDGYLSEIARVLRPDGRAVIHYADKTKAAAQEQGSNFSDMTPDKMKTLFTVHGLKVINEDTTRISHSSIATVVPV